VRTPAIKLFYFTFILVLLQLLCGPLKTAIIIVKTNYSNYSLSTIVATNGPIKAVSGSAALQDINLQITSRNDGHRNGLALLRRMPIGLVRDSE